MKTFSILNFLIFVCSISLVGQSTLTGKILEEQTQQAIEGVHLRLIKGIFKYETKTDEFGNYCFSNMDAGTYRLSIGKIGYESDDIFDVLLLMDEITAFNPQLTTALCCFGCDIATTYRPPLIPIDQCTSGSTLVMNKNKRGFRRH